jgi:hypothetical protein
MSTYKYPFATSEELKGVISHIDISFELENIHSSLLLAANEMKDIIGKDLWDLMINHYNSDNYEAEPEGEGEGEEEEEEPIPSYEQLDELVHLVQPALANFTMYHHFIWLQLRISNNSVTVIKGENETAAFKYQTDEAKDKLLLTAWVQINDLIDYLNEEATEWTEWEGETEYEIDDIVYYEETFYLCTEAHTSEDEFDADKWEELEEDTIIFHEWTLSEQCTELKELIFKDYKEFDKYYGIDKSAAFYIRSRFIINEIIKDDILPRESDPWDSTDETLLRKIKRFVAYKTMATAIFRFDFWYLPGSIRKTINNEMLQNNRFRDVEVAKTAIYQKLLNKAEEYLMEIDHYISSLDEPEDEDETIFSKFEVEYDDEDKFIAMI